MLNLSDEANDSKRNKSAFSDTVSNPDLDEIFFTKHKGTPPVAPSGFAFNIGPPTSAANLRI